MRSPRTTYPSISTIRDGDSEASRERLGIILYDDIPLVRQGLRVAIESDSRMVVCGLTGNPDEFLEMTARSAPDVAIVGMSMPDFDGLDLVRKLCKITTETRVLVLAMDDEPVYAERALRLGARGFIPKSSALEDVVSAVWTLVEGEVVVTKNTAERLLQQIAGKGPEQGEHPVYVLSRRETEVFELVGAGMSRREIAERLSLATKTVDAYRTRIKSKLNIDSMPELVRSAVRWVERDRMGGGRQASRASHGRASHSSAS